MLTLILIVLLVMTMSFFKLTISPLYISYITIGTLLIATVLTAHNIIFVASTLSNIQVINSLIYIASVAWLVNTKMYFLN